MNVLTIISSACPLLICALGALCSEYAGILALFMEGLICLSGFLTYFFTILTSSPILGCIFSLILSCLITFIFSIFVEHFNANRFIAGLAMNLIFASATTLLSSKIFGTQGVLTNSAFVFNVTNVKIWTIIITVIFYAGFLILVGFTKPGLYLRITGSDADVLKAKGVNPGIFRIVSWILAAGFSSLCGSFLVLRISSFVPNISSGRGWMALAAVYIGKKKPWKIAVAVLIFCFADIFASSIQNFLPAIPSAVLLSFPYLIVILLISIGK